MLIKKRNGKKVKKVKEHKRKPMKESTKELIKKIEELERRHQTTQKETDKELKNKGIYLAHPNAYKKCENCANFVKSSQCSSHNVEVSENHSCKRFYSYKTVLGGAFSPR